MIMPDLAKTSTRLMETLDTKLAQVDATLCSKIQEEEERAKHFQTQQKNSLDWLKLFHEKMAMLARDMMADMLRQHIAEQARQGKEAVERIMQNEVNSLQVYI